MQHADPSINLTDVIIKVKQREPLTDDEEFAYLVYVEGLPEAEANLLMKEWYESKHKDE
jgi:hypothetical protein